MEVKTTYSRKTTKLLNQIDELIKQTTKKLVLQYNQSGAVDMRRYVYNDTIIKELVTIKTNILTVAIPTSVEVIYAPDE